MFHVRRPPEFVASGCRAIYAEQATAGSDRAARRKTRNASFCCSDCVFAMEMNDSENGATVSAAPRRTSGRNIRFRLWLIG
jgi:hypothetical protein